jgi:hypothetical protein
MTVRPFDARASHTPHAFHLRGRRRPRIVRIAWILGRCIRREPVPYDAYRMRFAEPEHSFHHDLAALRRARIRRGTELIGSSVS